MYRVLQFSLLVLCGVDWFRAIFRGWSSGRRRAFSAALTILLFNCVSKLGIPVSSLIASVGVDLY